MMDLTNPAQVATLVQALAALADRINDDVNALGPGRRDRSEAGRLIVHRDDLNRIVGRLGDPAPHDEDTNDVTDPVRGLAIYLSRLHPGFPPTHPYAGTHKARAERGDPGHCWVCAVVGHVVAHPGRGCDDVSCDHDHTAGPAAPPEPVAPVAPPWVMAWVPPGMHAVPGPPRFY